ncbi:LAMI_0D01376g1_1 [Lachancea mirantina]|uniref:LAMI_0D01376g1_1 n=1 Tax=Lachancea mirantina TaxID=1230905 RepID=A0A1G4J8M4_9SACH|nr:LAMI_0D01376g1_1 [Lachancea mirantina]
MTSVKEQYRGLVNRHEREICFSSLRQDSTEYQAGLTSVIGEFLDLKKSVQTTLALFSSNETLEDVATASLPLLALDYYLASCIARKQATQLSNSKDRAAIRQKFLHKSVQLDIQFLVSLADYEILDSLLHKKIDNFESTYSPTLQELYSQPSDSKDIKGAQMRRQQKIELHQKSTSLAAQISALEARMATEGQHDEILRDLYVDQLRDLSYRAFSEVEQNLSEIELLSNFISAPQEQIEQTDVSNVPLNEEGYTEKVEVLNRPLLSKSGKVLRTFTLVDDRSKSKNKVFGYGQYAPTMSVEEFLEKEFESGRVLEGGAEPKLEEDEDDEAWNDKQTYKAREWDAFTEANPKGSGNTLNRG